MKKNLIKSIQISNLQEADVVLMSAGTEDLFEKAKHQDGDMHPNGKWVWVSGANGGKGDWRVIKRTSSSSSGSASVTGQKTAQSGGVKKQVNTQLRKKVGKDNSDISFQLFDRKSGHEKYYEISPIPDELKNSSFIRIISPQDSKSGRKEFVPEIEFRDGEKFSERLFSKKDAIDFIKRKILEKRDDSSITLKITNNGSGVVKLSDSVNAEWQDVKDEDFGGRIIGIKIDGKFGSKAFPYSFDSMKRKKYNLYTFEEAKAEAEEYLNNERLKLKQQG